MRCLYSIHCALHSVQCKASIMAHNKIHRYLCQNRPSAVLCKIVRCAASDRNRERGLLKYNWISHKKLYLTFGIFEDLLNNIGGTLVGLIKHCRYSSDTIYIPLPLSHPLTSPPLIKHKHSTSSLTFPKLKIHS